jgi:hypothetical protein
VRRGFTGAPVGEEGCEPFRSRRLSGIGYVRHGEIARNLLTDRIIRTITTNQKHHVTYRPVAARNVDAQKAT